MEEGVEVQTVEDNGGSEEEAEFLFGRSVLFNVSRFTACRSIPVGKFRAGTITSSPGLIFGALSSFFIHSEDPCSDVEGQFTIFCKTEPKTKKKKIASWRVLVKVAATLHATKEFCTFYSMYSEYKHHMRPTFSLEGEDDSEVYIHLRTKPDSVANDLASAQQQLQMANSVPHSLNLMAVTWNKLLRLAYPEKEHLFVCNASLPSIQPPKREDFDEFFEKVRIRRSDPLLYPLSVERLTCTLRPYQIAAARFMIDRELNAEVRLGEDNLFNAVQISGGMYFFTHFGVFCGSDNVQNCAVTGGILADQMGLGKTVELLALIFSLRPDNINLLRKDGGRGGNTILSETDPVKEVVDYLVSSVVAADEGAVGLNTILKSRTVSNTDRIRNLYFNVNARNLMKDQNIQKMPQISCTECGTKCLRANMHWKKEFDAQRIPFICPDCVFQGPAMQSGATLIVLPQVLCHQWYEEIKKHVREDVVIDVYMGVEKDGYKHPVYLSRCDIVIASYETLRAELDYISVGTKHNLRKRNYEMQKCVTSPLLCIDWWRICLDESQLVESRGSMAARMCSKLSSRARWCVTGTPLIHSVDDLFGLVGFLELYPFNQKNVWKTQLWNNYIQGREEALIQFVAQFFWRNSVKHVKDQLDLPAIRHEVTEMAFSPLEERLYQEKLYASLTALRHYLQTLTYNNRTLLSDLSDAQQHQLLGILNEVRLFILTGGSHLKMSKKEVEQREVPYSPELLFRRLFIRQKVKMDQCTREYIFSLCALCGLLNLYHPDEAPVSYMKTFEIEKNLEKLNLTFKENKVQLEKGLRVDTTQLYHVCKALIDLRKSVTLPESVDIPLLGARILDMSDRYTRKELHHLAKHRNEWDHLKENWVFYDKAFDSCISWIQFYLDRASLDKVFGLRAWAAELELAICANMDDLISKSTRVSFPHRLFFLIQDKLERQHGDLRLLRAKMAEMAFDNAEEKCVIELSASDTFKQMMDCHHNEQFMHREDTRRDADEEVAALMAEPTRPRRNAATLVEQDFDSANCAACEMDRCVRDLEESLQMRDMFDRRLPLEDNELFRLCKEISHFRVGVNGFVLQMKKLWKWFEYCRRMTLFSKKVLVSIKELVCRHRELREAERRLEVGMELEMPGFLAQKIVLPPQETSAVKKAIQLWNTRCEQKKVEIARVTTQIMYYNTLKNSNENTVRECPVCYSEITRSWHVFPCAHLICNSCFKQLKLNSINPMRTRQVLNCVTCREGTTFDGVFLVVEDEEREADPELPNVKLPVKYDAILRKLRKILKSDPTNKVLIFTSLNEAMDSFCDLLNAAKVVHRRLTTLDPIRIADFRNDPAVRVLIMSLNNGANGLNLTQANHIFFLEPTTEKATVAQAIGRMARMGQHRAMTVHNFVVKGSVEEEVQRLAANVIGEDGWTIDQLDHLLSFGGNALG